MDSLNNLHELLAAWAAQHRRTGDLAQAVHAVNAILYPRATQRTRLTRNSEGRHIVTDGHTTYVAASFREAQSVLRRCHDEQIGIDGYIALYCED
jgi:hypothetical protein